MTPWGGSIFDARESKYDNLKETQEGDYKYEKSGTYGQSEYTVRERKDGTYDVYVQSDSSRNHSHDRIDKDGNIIDRYHDCMLEMLTDFTFDEVSDLTPEAIQKDAQKILKKAK